jgi:hypothetical protein
MTQPQIAEAFNVHHLAGTGDFVNGAFVVPEGQTARGMGQLFTSTDVTQWGFGEWAAVIVGGYVAISLFNDLKNVGSKVGKKGKAVKRKVSKTAKSGTSTVGTLVLIGGIGAAVYFGYQYYQHNQAATPAAGSTT